MTTVPWPTMLRADPLEDRLEELLAHGRWEPDPGWSVDGSEENRFRRRLRIVEPAKDEDADESPPFGRSDRNVSEWPPRPPGPKSVRDDARHSTREMVERLNLDEVLERLDRRPGGVTRTLARLAQRRSLAGWNAAILLARRDPTQGPAAVLRRLVVERPEYDPETTFERSRGREAWQRVQKTLNGSGDEASALPETIPVSMSTRVAAGEAWVAVLASRPGDSIALLAPAGRVLEDRKLSAELRAGLMRAVGRHVPPALLPFAEDVFDDRAPVRAPAIVRRSLAEACLAFAVLHSEASTDSWPTTFRLAETDTDAIVRATYGRWLAVTKRAGAEDTLIAALSDESVIVRKEAIGSLGRLHTDEARRQLERLARGEGEADARLAVRALSQWGIEALRPFAGNERSKVRRAVAVALADHEGDAAAGILVEMASDRQILVQEAAVAATERWSDASAAPVLFAVMEDGVQKARMQAFQALRKRREIAHAYNPAGHLDERRMGIAVLARQLNLPQIVTHAAPREPAPEERARRDDVQALVRDLDSALTDPQRTLVMTQRLRALGPEGVPALETAAETVSPAAAAIIENEILPALGEVHEALAKLDHADVLVRRSAATRIAAKARTGTLSRLATRRLHGALVDEPDRLVWRSALRAVEADANTGIDGIVLLALNHDWPDVRRDGCAYVARHGRPHHARWLLPLFDDGDPTVRLAAARAAGRCRNPIVATAAPTGGDDGAAKTLHDLLRDVDARVRFAAAIALARLGDPVGVSEMVRRIQPGSGDESERLTVIVTMGETGNETFVAPLVTLGWSEEDPRIRRAVVVALERIVPLGLTPERVPTEEGDRARLMRWSEWVEGRDLDRLVRRPAFR